MLVSKATKGFFKNAVFKAEYVSVGIIRYPQNTSQTKELLLVQRRYKKSSTDEKKRCKENPNKSRPLTKLATVVVVGTTIAVIAAKYDDDFRSWTKENVPALDNLVKFVFQEEETYLQSLDRLHKELSAWIKKALYDLFKGSKKKIPKPSEPSVDDKGAAKNVWEANAKKPPYVPPPSVFDELIASQAEKKDVEKKDKDASTKIGQALPTNINELKTLEDKFRKTSVEVMDNLASASQALLVRSALLGYMDTIISQDKSKAWKDFRQANETYNKSIEKSKTNKEKLKAIEKELLTKLEDESTISSKIKEKLKTNINAVNKDIDNEEADIDKIKEKHVLAKTSWAKVKEARLHFSEQLETLFPNIWLNDPKLSVPLDQFDTFTENVLNDLEHLNREVDKFQALDLGKIDFALRRYKTFGQEANDDIVEAFVSVEESKEKRKLRADLQKLILAQKAKSDKNTKSMLKQTAEVYAELTAEALRIKEREVERKMQQKQEERLAKLRAQHKMEIAKMIGRMQGANEAIATRGQEDKSQQVKQQFWSAAQSLMAAVKPIGAAAQGQGPKPLKNEITNINKVKPEGDELVDSVLSTIPQEAVDKGVPSEALLRERFMKVMSCARGWAGIPTGEISLLQLLLARVQSALYLNVAIPQAELDNEPAIDPDQLNNYDILFRAQYYVDKGEFDQAIRYLNLLKGPSGKVASDWVKDALVYLETKQAAEVLLAHATAISMKA